MQDKPIQDPMAPDEPAARAQPAPGAVGAVEAVAEPRREDAGAGGFLTDPATPAAEDGVLAPAGVPDGDDYGEFAWPEGFQVNPAALGRFVPLARELGLDKAGAQRLAQLYAELDQDRHREQAAFIAGQNKEWRDEIRSHPEYGGANLERTAGDVARTMRRYGSPRLMEQIRQMNVQNWPEMFYFLARVSRAVSEDCSPGGGPDSGAAVSTARLLFPGLR